MREIVDRLTPTRAASVSSSIPALVIQCARLMDTKCALCAHYVNHILCAAAHGQIRLAGYAVCMIRTDQNNKGFSRMHRAFLREWRNHRGLTLEDVADQIGMTHGNLSRIERGLQPYDEECLEGLARVYKCSPIDLLSRNPNDPEGLWAIWDNLREPQKRQGIAVLRALREDTP